MKRGPPHDRQTPETAKGRVKSSWKPIWGDSAPWVGPASWWSLGSRRWRHRHARTTSRPKRPEFNNMCCINLCVLQYVRKYKHTHVNLFVHIPTQRHIYIIALHSMLYQTRFRNCFQFAQRLKEESLGGFQRRVFDFGKSQESPRMPV